jgi:hypothetical protein
MVATRSKRTENNSPKGPLNPNNASNWPAQPTTEAEMNAWIQTTRKALLEWLTHTGNAAKSSKTKAILEKKKADIKLDTTWTDTWLPETDYDTGEIYDTNKQKKMTKQMRAKMASLRNLHSAKDTYESDQDFKYAQASWEDFLYYQNEWNRRRHSKHFKHYDPSETKAEYLEKARAIEKQKNINKRSEHYVNWRDNMIYLMNLYRIGDRNRAPEPLKPDNLHQYSSSVRELYRDPVKTSEREKHRDKERKSYLRKAFPRRDFKIDDSAFERECQKTNSKTNGFFDDPKTKLSKNHKYHHGATERSDDHPTSFEEKAWGWTIKGLYSYVHDKIDQLTMQKIVDPRTQYQKRTEHTTVPGFLLELNSNGEVRGRDRDGVWYGIEMDEQIDIEVYDLDESGQRVKLLPPNRMRYVQTRTYVPVEELKGEDEHPGRRDNAAEPYRDPAEFSDISSNRDSDIDATSWLTPEAEWSDGSDDDENDLFTISYLEGCGRNWSKVKSQGSTQDDSYALVELDPTIVPMSVAALPRSIYNAINSSKKRLRELDTHEKYGSNKALRTS